MMDPYSLYLPSHLLQLVNKHKMASTIDHYQRSKNQKKKTSKSKIKKKWDKMIRIFAKMKSASDLIGKQTGPTAGLNSIGPVFAMAISFNIDNGS